LTRSLKVAQNVLTTLISQVVTWALSFAVILYLPHYAGVTGLGRLTLASAFAGMFSLLSSIGSSTVMMRDIPRDVTSTGKLILASLIIRLPLAIISIVIGLGVGELFGYGHELLLLIGLGLVAATLGVVTDTISSAIRGLQNFVIANVGTVIDKVISSLLIVAVCIVRWPLWIIVAAPIISSSIALLYMFQGLNKSNIEWKMPDFQALKSLLMAGLPFVSAGVFVAIYARSDAIFLSKLSTIQAIGWYGLAFRIGGTAMTLPSIVCTAMLPPLSALYRETKAGFIDGTARLINLMIICCIPIAAVMIICPVPLIEVFSHNTPSFLPAANVVRVYGVAVMLWFVSQAIFTGIVACDQQKAVASSMGIAAVVSIPLTAGCVFIGQHDFHNGAVGAAASDLLIEVLLLVFYCNALPKGTISSTLIGVTLKGLVAATPFLATVYFLPLRFGLLASIPCLILYGVLCLQLRCLHYKDIELFSRIVGGKFGVAK
jgi:O-antigen/teichoic acid export membrane protein